MSNNELDYKINVEPAIMAVMAQVEADAKSFDITDDHINRGVYRWVMERMVDGPVPEWYMQELDEIDRAKNE